MRIRRGWIACAAALALAAGTASAQQTEPAPASPGRGAPAARVKEMEGTTCPVAGGPIDKKIYCDYKGTRYYFCCVGCQGKFKADPERYIEKTRKE